MQSENIDGGFVSKLHELFDETWIVVLLLVVFFPLGLYALWKNGSLSPGAKQILGTVATVIFVLGLGNGSALSSKDIAPTTTRITSSERTAVQGIVHQSDVQAKAPKSEKASLEKTVSLPSPSEACKLLKTTGLSTGSYKHQDGSRYGCLSPYQKIGREKYPYPKTSLAYYVSGTRSRVDELRLTLDVHTMSDFGLHASTLARRSELLHESVFKSSLPENVTRSIANGETDSWTRPDGLTLKTERENWPTGKGATLRFIIASSQ